MMAKTGLGSAYVINAIVAQEVIYGLHFGPGFAILLVLSTTLTGFGLAGICRRFLVWPANALWPQNLASYSLFHALHKEDNRNRRRYRFFWYAITCSFFWYFVPSIFFRGLTFFSWVCWIVPNNLVVSQLFGTSFGLGMGFITFDWSQIAYISSPLIVPWWAHVNMFAGFVLAFWIILPVLYYTNTWHLAYMPISRSSAYDRFGHLYKAGKIQDSTNRFDPSKYEAYSALYFPASYAVIYLLMFAMLTALLVHTILYHGHTIYNAIKGVEFEEDNPHTKLMQAYPEVPSIWYASISLVFFGVAIVAVQVWPTDMPVWGLALSLLVPIIYLLPCGFIFAATGQRIDLNLLGEILAGVLLNGRPVAYMIFNGYITETMSSALTFTQDLKLGHYLKVPPRASFKAQFVAALLAGILQVGIKEIMFRTVKDMCEWPHSQFACPQTPTIFKQLVIWGLIGPSRQFGPGSLYHGHLWALLVGAFLPVPFWWWQRRFPKSRLRYISIPVFLAGPTFIPDAKGINYSSWFLVGFIFQYLLRKRNVWWWSTFNYILSAALDSGTASAHLVLYIATISPLVATISSYKSFYWWGNLEAVYNLDMLPFITLAPGQAFDGLPGR